MNRFVVVLALGVGVVSPLYPQFVPRVLQSMKGLATPEPSQLSAVVANRNVAIALGKALFWDVQVGSDGRTACASCHFHAGADVRFKNQVSPGLNREGASSFHFDNTRTGTPAGPNATMKPGDFPFRVLASAVDRNSAVLYETKDSMGSQGVHARTFLSASPGASEDLCADRMDLVFSNGAASFRQVTARNAPSVINSVYNVRNFLDGRANPLFNGVDSFGPRNAGAVIYRGSPAVATRILLDNASLASQAVAPPVDATEMSCSGRTWPEIGKRLLAAVPLKRQLAAPDDSVLGGYAAANGQKGLRTTYQAMVRESFISDLWNSTSRIAANGRTYTQEEMNFSLFFGVAVQMYLSTLVSNDAPIDRYFANYPATTAANATALSEEEIAGLNIFMGKGRCVTCHSGPELTNSGTPARLAAAGGVLVDRMVQGNGLSAAYDFGYYNIGVRPTSDDLGLGRRDPWGVPFSLTRQAVSGIRADSFTVDTCRFTLEPCAPLPANAPIAVDGAFKTPTLRNIALTGPYFHNGSRATLEEVVEFYNRGGDRQGTLLSDTSGYGGVASNLGPDIRALSLLEFEKSALLAFLKNALTDERVRWERAPFDHPELPLADGHTSTGVTHYVLVPAVGRAGRTSNPLKPFHELLAGGTLGYPAASVDSLNGAPTVSLAFPAAGATFQAPASISLFANAWDPDDNLTKVEFLVGSTKLGEVASAPYVLQWTGVAAGTYAVTARAWDAGGLTASATVNLTVSAPAVQPSSVTAIRNAGSGLCVDLHGGVTVPATPAVEWMCRSAASQNFRFEATAGSNSTFRIVSAHSNLCLEVAGGSSANAAPVVQQVCTGATHQQFRLESQSGGTHRILAVHSGKSLTAGGSAGAMLEQQEWSNLVRQRWTIGAVQGPAVSITSPVENAVLPAPANLVIGATAVNAAKVEFFQDGAKIGEDASAPYSFNWTQPVPGFYTLSVRAVDAQSRVATASVRVRVQAGVATAIANSASGNCLDLLGGLAVQRACNGGATQLFRLAPVAGSTGLFTIQSEAGTSCLEVYGASAADAAPLIASPCSNAAGQRFGVAKQADGLYRLTTPGGKAVGGGASRVEQQTWNGQASQKWRIDGLQ